MTAHSIKTLLSTLLSYCLVGVFTSAVLANADGKGFVSMPGVTRREPSRSGGALTQTPGGRPEQQAPPAGKRKSLHEYGPEDVHPEARENENSGLRKDQQPKASNRTPLAPRSTDAPAPAPTSTPTVTPTLAPAVLSAPATAMTRSTPQPAPQKVKNTEPLRRKLLVNSSIFLLLLLALIFFVIKMWRQLREDKQAAGRGTPQEQIPAARKRQPGADGQAAAEKHVDHSDTSPDRLKTKMRKGHLTGFKKA